MTGTGIIKGPGRPTRYKLADGTIVPSVTTITSRFKESGGLIQWAYQKGLEGKRLYEEIQEAGDIGRQIHEFIEHDIHGEGVGVSTVPRDIRISSGFDAWVKWRDKWIERFTHTEVPLISERYHFGGTPDALGVDRHMRPTLLDWKSAGAVYTENLCQLAAYGKLVEEVLGIKLTGGYHLVRFSKEHADLEHRHYSSLSDALELFHLYRQAYELDKKVKQRAR